MAHQGHLKYIKFDYAAEEAFGSPCHHLGHWDPGSAQNFGAEVTRGSLLLNLIFKPFPQKCQNVNAWDQKEIETTPTRRIWSPMGPRRPHGGPRGFMSIVPPWGPKGAQGSPFLDPMGPIPPLGFRVEKCWFRLVAVPKVPD